MSAANKEQSDVAKKWKVIGVEQARALASLNVCDIYARAGKYSTWVFCDPADAPLYDFTGITDAEHAEANKEAQYRVAVE